VYEVAERRMMADHVVFFINDAIQKSAGDGIKTLIYQSGPTSFTTHRIINSIVKGFIIANRKLELIAVSSFLTYFLIASKEASNGLLCIPTMRGDHFTCEYKGSVFSAIKVQGDHQITTAASQIFFEDSSIFNGINLASHQINTMTSKNVDTNKIPEINYGHTLEYRY
jgi:tRNA A37 threonylcarbamoyladenosine modification protein TsaB